jgi:hypothetical protein
MCPSSPNPSPHRQLPLGAFPRGFPSGPAVGEAEGEAQGGTVFKDGSVVAAVAHQQAPPGGSLLPDLLVAAGCW